MKQSDIDSIKKYYTLNLGDSWEMSVDHLQYEQLVIIKKSLRYNLWVIRTELKKMFINPIIEILKP